MEYLFLFLGLLILLFSVKRSGAISPIGVVAMMVYANMVVFYVTEVMKQGASSELILSHNYKFLRSYGDSAMGFYLMYTFLLLFFAMIAIFAGKKPPQLEQIEISENQGPKRPPWFLTLFSSLLFLYVLIHIAMTELKFLEPYTVYLELRDATYYGLNNALSRSLHANIGIVGVVSAAILYLGLNSRSRLTVLFATTCFLYVALFQLVSHSRWLIVQLVILLVLLQADRRLKNGSLSVILLLTIPFFYLIALQARSATELGVDAVFNVSLSNYSYVDLINILANIFSGGLVFSEAAGLSAADYSIQYKILSFSPVPSAIDGFHAYRSEEARINIYAPFSAIVEAYRFGPFGLATLFGLVGCSLWFTQKLWNLPEYRRNHATTGFANLCFGLTLYAHLFLHQYPLRNGSKWIWFALVFALIGLFLAGRRKRSTNR